MTDTATAVPYWHDTDPRDAARALLALGGAIDDALVLADALTSAAMRDRKAPTVSSLVLTNKATTQKVAKEAARIIRARLQGRDDKWTRIAEWENQRFARDAERRRLDQPVPRSIEHRWDTQGVAERLFHLRVEAVEKAWDAAGFREPSTSWVDRAGEKVSVVTTPNAHDVPMVTTKVSKVWDRKAAYSGTRVSRSLFVRTTWRADVLHRGLLTLRRKEGEPLFVLDARPEGDGLWVSFVRPGRGFALVHDTAVLVRSPDGAWTFPTSRRASKGVR